MNYPKIKVYFDGSHYIGIPHITQKWKKKKVVIKQSNTEESKKIKEIYRNSNGETKKEKIVNTIEKVNEDIQDIEKSTKLVNETLEKEKRNKIVRQTRLSRKIGLQNWTHFCTFTYDSNKLNEEEFRVKFLNCLRHLASRKGWKYIGVFERSPVNQRLHFHGIFVIPEKIDLIETKDYSTKTHQMQITHQNTFFLERFGRNDFKSIESKQHVNESKNYLMKYIEKSNEKIVYSKGLPTYFVSDILEEDVICTIGQEDRKILLFDNFTCLDEGLVVGKVSKETIEQMPKCN